LRSAPALARSVATSPGAARGRRRHSPEMQARAHRRARTPAAAAQRVRDAGATRAAGGGRAARTSQRILRRVRAITRDEA